MRAARTGRHCSVVGLCQRMVQRFSLLSYESHKLHGNCSCHQAHLLAGHGRPIFGIAVAGEVEAGQAAHVADAVHVHREVAHEARDCVCASKRLPLRV